MVRHAQRIGYLGRRQWSVAWNEFGGHGRRWGWWRVSLNRWPGRRYQLSAVLGWWQIILGWQ